MLFWSCRYIYLSKWNTFGYMVMGAKIENIFLVSKSQNRNIFQSNRWLNDWMKKSPSLNWHVKSRSRKYVNLESQKYLSMWNTFGYMVIRAKMEVSKSQKRNIFRSNRWLDDQMKKSPSWNWIVNPRMLFWSHRNIC